MAAGHILYWRAEPCYDTIDVMCRPTLTLYRNKSSGRSSYMQTNLALNSSLPAFVQKRNQMLMVMNPGEKCFSFNIVLYLCVGQNNCLEEEQQHSSKLKQEDPPPTHHPNHFPDL